MPLGRPSYALQLSSLVQGSSRAPSKGRQGGSPEGSSLPGVPDPGPVCSPQESKSHAKAPPRAPGLLTPEPACGMAVRDAAAGCHG